MRCPKCGFISFDHLSVCDKCGEELSIVRRKLNLLDFNPNPPNFFGMFRPPSEANSPAVQSAPTEREEIADAVALDLSSDEQRIDVAPTVVPIPEGETAVDGPIELNDAQLAELDQDEAPIVLGIDDSVDDEVTAVSASDKIVEEDVFTLEIDDDELELELSEEEMERIILELEQGERQRNNGKDKKSQEPVDLDGDIIFTLDEGDEES